MLSNSSVDPVVNLLVEELDHQGARRLSYDLTHGFAFTSAQATKGQHYSSVPA